MGFLDRRVRAQGERLIASYAKGDEELLHRDLVEDESGYLVRGIRPKERRLDVLATTRAVYFERHGQMLSILRYDAIAYAASVTNPLGYDALELISHDGDVLRMGFPMKDRGLGHIVQERLLRLDPYDATREIAGVLVTLSYRPGLG